MIFHSIGLRRDNNVYISFDFERENVLIRLKSRGVLTRKSTHVVGRRQFAFMHDLVHPLDPVRN